MIDVTLDAHRLRMTSVGMPTAADVKLLIEGCTELTAGIALDRARFEAEVGGTYDYRVYALDGRLWRQTLTFAGAADIDPGMTFNVAQPWKLSEFQAQRLWRLRCITMRARVGATLIRIDQPN